jgi:hypothetical protein
MSELPREGVEERFERREREEEELTRLLLRAAFLLGSDPDYARTGWRANALRQTRLALIEVVGRWARRGRG